MRPQGSALYIGHVVHTRLRPVRHRLRYALPMFLLDLDELADLGRRLPGFSHNRVNLFSFHDKDHLAGTDESLRAQIERQLMSADFGPVGAISVLCMPRVLGLAFNPLSVFFCHKPDGGLGALLYEVNNTFGQRHSYLVSAGTPVGRLFRHIAAKRFYVSPFMEMDMQYLFRLAPPGERAFIAIDVRNGAEPTLAASFVGARRPLTGGSLLKVFLRFPLLTLQVLGGIHWEALKLWSKGMRPLPRPAPPAEPVSHSGFGGTR